MLSAMVTASRLLPLINLLLALLTRWLGLWRAGPPPARFVATLARTEAVLAEAIRATLAQEGVAVPGLDDAALLVWVKARSPAVQGASMPRPGAPRPHARPVQSSKLPIMDRRLPAGFGAAGWKPPVRRARAPP
jgi:hypothetical protein